jgi:hypothetical protein
VRRRPAVVAAALLVLAAARAPAQTAAELVTQGVTAYRALEFDAAAALLRRALAMTGGDALADTSRPGVWVYVGATDVFRGRRDSANTAFRQALLADPRHRPDPLVFPPEVANAFDAVRRGTAFVRVAAPRDTVIILGDQLYVARLYASALHDVAVELTLEDGRVARRLYAGPIGDSLDVRWEGLDSTGRAPLEGRLVFQVTSRAAGRGRIVRLPLATRVVREDTLPHPPAPAAAQLLPEREPAGPALRTLGAGVLTGLFAAVLPQLIAQDGGTASGRYVVAGALGTAGVIGFLAQRPGRVIPANVAANRAARDAWQREVAMAVAENARRRRDIGLQVTAGRATAIERDMR